MAGDKSILSLRFNQDQGKNTMFFLHSYLILARLKMNKNIIIVSSFQVVLHVVWNLVLECIM